MKSKSPFFVIQEFISPLFCEEIVNDLCLKSPKTTHDGTLVASHHNSSYGDKIITEKIRPIISDIELHYNTKIKSMTKPAFEWYPTNCKQGEPISENSKRIGTNNWMRIAERDLSCILFLSDYNEKPGFEEHFECYGGKLNFPSWRFGFNPQRGTLIIYPSVPQFINVTSTVFAGNLIQSRFHFLSQMPLIFNHADFPGDFRTWFETIA